MRLRKRSISVLLLFVVWLIALYPPHRMAGSARLLPSFLRQTDTLPAADSLVGAFDTLLFVPPKPLSVDTLLAGLAIPFVDSLTTVADASRSLAAFFDELKRVQSKQDTVISIVHLGDSHIQAGYYSGRVMRLLHAAFGNAGRGWIAPFKLSKLNEPDDYFFSSVVKEWTSGKITQSAPKAPIGPGAIGILSVSPAINMDIAIAPKNGAGYTFSEAIFYRGASSMPMFPAGTLKDSITFLPSAPLSAKGILADTFRIRCLTDSLQLHSTRRKQGTDSLLPAASFINTYFGASLLNGAPGVLYHSIGVNGSMFVNYSRSDYLEQLALLRPSLLIVSLGTNETFGRRFRSEEFAGQIRDFLALVKYHLPQAAILLTTPPECYKRVWVDKKRTYARNANTEYAARTIARVADEQGIACWDLFAATGGKNSHKKWYDKKLMGRDRIHFNKDGYRDQGTLLFAALMRLYNDYLAAEEADNQQSL